METQILIPALLLKKDYLVWN